MFQRFVFLVTVCCACGGASQRDAETKPVASVTKLAGSEAVVFDRAHDVYFVSNVNGDPAVRDNNGFITRITADGVVDSLHFIQGGRAGVVLSAPMGSRIQGDTLWVLDVDALRGFNTLTGAPLAVIDLSPLHPIFLNDVAIGPDGDFYITDTGYKPTGHTGPDRIYHVDRSRRVTVALESAALTQPDGIDWDGARKHAVLAPIGGSVVQTWQPGSKTPDSVVAGAGRFDGVEVEPDGAILITSWNDSSVSTLDGARLTQRLRLKMSPSDVSMDTKRKRVGVVSMQNDQFELWAWPEARK
jgi:sugar lactone lactonase YvrE